MTQNSNRIKDFCMKKHFFYLLLFLVLLPKAFENICRKVFFFFGVYIRVFSFSIFNKVNYIPQLLLTSETDANYNHTRMQGFLIQY